MTGEDGVGQVLGDAKMIWIYGSMYERRSVGNSEDQEEG